MRGLALVLASMLLLAGCVGIQDGEGLDPTANATPDDGSTEDGTSNASESTNETGPSEGTGEGANETAANGGDGASGEQPPGVRPAKPRVVVAVIDTGTTLYHEAFEAPRPWPGPRPAEATPVPLSLGVGGFDEALDADRGRLMNLSTGTLYTFPGTRIVGGISFDEPGGDWPILLDRPPFGHGTMTTSRAVGSSTSIPGDDPAVGLVIVQGILEESVQWAARQDFVDVISISSSGTFLGLAPGAGNAALDLIEAYHQASHAKPLFLSTGNGVANSGTVGFPTWLRGPSGVPDAFSVGANDNANIAHWGNYDPYVSADGCANPAAEPGSTSEVANEGGGTSSSAPFAAGGAAKVILQARRLLGDTEVGPRVDEDRSAPEDAWSSGRPADARIVLAEGDPGAIARGPLADGVFTMRELKDVLYHTALVTPTDDRLDGQTCNPTTNGRVLAASYVPASTVPEEERFPFQGYGEVNRESVDRAVSVLEGTAELPQRPAADEQYERAHEARELFVARQLPSSP